MLTQTEWDYYITPDGVSHNLHDFGVRFIMSRDGYGMPPLEWHTSRGPFQHGETPLDYRLRPRTIQMIMRWQASSRLQLWQNRLALLDILRPNRSATATPGRLRKILPDGSVRDILVHVQSGPSFGPDRPDRWEEWSFEEVVRFVAHDPLFFDPTQQVYTPAPMVGTANLVYLGDWEEWPIIEYVGQMNDPVITNLTTGLLITLTYNIPAGRTVTINLAPGYKTVVDDLGANLIQYITNDLTTWNLESDPLATDGVNQIQFAVGASWPGSAMSIRYYHRWVGI